jgi:undecaprenyl-diphosphatase
MHDKILDRVMVISTFLGDNGLIWIIIACLLMVNKKYRTLGLMVLGAMLLGTILGEGMLKHIFHRIRPSADIPPMQLLIRKPMTYSFPSGHTTSSFAAAGVLSKYLKSYAFGFFTLAFLIAFSRIYLFVHYPTDVLAGIVLGLICSRIIVFIFSKIKDIN